MAEPRRACQRRFRVDRVLVQPAPTPFQHRNAQSNHLRDPPHPARPRSLTPHRRCPAFGEPQSASACARGEAHRESWRITRFDRPAQLTSWAGPTPRHHESDTTVHRGRITKQGSRLVRWAAVEAVQCIPAHHPLLRRVERGVRTRTRSGPPPTSSLRSLSAHAWAVLRSGAGFDHDAEWCAQPGAR